MSPRPSRLRLLRSVRLAHNGVGVVRVGRYCEVCLRFVEYGPEIPGGGLEWLNEPCDSCLERAAAEQAQLDRLEEMWAARECAAPDCSEVFTPARVGQRFHDDRCRKRTHRWTKARVRSG